MVENRVCFTVRGEFGAQMSFEAKNTSRMKICASVSTRIRWLS